MIVQYRKSLGLTQEAFGALFGLKSKGQVSEIERMDRCSADVALAIEAHSNHRIDAALLNETVAAARQSMPALCTTCDHRLDDPTIRACNVRECPNVQREAA